MFADLLHREHDRSLGGTVILAYYVAYTAYLMLAATHADVTGQFAVVMLGFVIPLTFVGLAISVVRARVPVLS